MTKDPAVRLRRLACGGPAIWALVAALATATPGMNVRADPVKPETASLADALGRDSETTLHFRSHYLARDRSAATDSLAWAGGGWLGYRSGWAADALRLGLTAYTSQKLHGPDDKDGASLLLTGQRSYTVLGEAYGAAKVHDQVLRAGRFLVNEFEVNPQDNAETIEASR